MDFSDDAKLKQAELAKAAEEQRLKDIEWSKVIIPDELATRTADGIYNAMKRDLLVQCQDKRNIKYDYGYSNPRYEISLPKAYNNRINLIKVNSPLNYFSDSVLIT